MDDTREEGELSGSDFEEAVYNPVARPDAGFYRSIRPQALSDDDSSESEDSDSDSGLPLRKKHKIVDTRTQASMHITQNGNKQRKRNNIWSNVLQEEGLMEDIGGVGLKKINSDRNVESYDYTQALKLHGKYESDPEEEEEEEDIEDKPIEVDKKSNVHERIEVPNNFSRKRKREKTKRKPRFLKKIKDDPMWSEEFLGNLIAESLFEPNIELIVRCVEVLGRQKALELYNETRKVEKEGGIMIMNGSRQRTSGGVYLHLLKTFEGIEKEHMDKIFVESKETHQARRKKKALRKLQRKQTKEHQNTDAMDDDGLHIRGLFSDDPGGTKCPGSTPVTTPQDSGSEGDEQKLSGFQSPPLPLKEVIERAALEIEERDSRSMSPRNDLHLNQEEMEIV